jgi:outer membrane protein TolC
MADAICVLSTLLLAGCTVGPNYKRPAAEVPPAYKEVGDWKTAQPNDQNLPGNWWEIFQDEQLNALELEVNISNQNLKAAEAQYTQARALLRYQRADYYPTVTVNPSATRNKFAANRQPHSPQFSGANFTD